MRGHCLKILYAWQQNSSMSTTCTSILTFNLCNQVLSVKINKFCVVAWKTV